MYAFEQMTGEVATGRETLDHLVEDGRLAHAVDAAEDVDLPVEVPDDMLAPAPEGVDLYLLDIVCVFLHIVSVFSFGKYKQNIGKLYR